jgi:dihydrolipoamide dehydrogenase
LKGNSVEVTGADGKKETISATNVILASGSVAIELPFAKFDGKSIIDNAGALDLTEVPKRLGVIGAGVIGLELGSVWKRLGSEVTMLEALPDFLGVADPDIAKVALREFKKQGLDIKLGAKLSKAEVKKDGVHLVYSDKDGEQKLVVDKLLVAVGRRAYTAGLLADDCGVKLDDRGRIAVDEHNHTGVDGVWAVGDAVRGPMLAHKGSEEGVAVAEWIAGKAGHVNLDTVPWVIYTEPEISWAGKTEKELKEEGIPYKVGSFPFAAIGRAVAMNEAVGQVKMLAHADTDRILGVHMVGPGVSELIAECVVAMEFKGSSEDLARIVHAHPTLSEAVHEAALSVDKRAIHKGN